MRRIALRLGQAVLVVWGAFTVSFIVLFLIPGDSVSVMLNANGGTAVDPGAEAKLRASLGLDGSFFHRYFHELGSYLHLDLGHSVEYGASVAHMLWLALPSTIVLTLSAMVLSVVAGIAFAAFVSYRPDNPIAALARILPAFGNSIPTFWVALILLQLFSFSLHIFPVTGQGPWYAVVLPAVTIAIPYGSMIAQVTLDGIRRAQAELYVMTARSKGIGPVDVHLRHVLPASLLPTISVIGLNFGTLLAGAVISETIYSRQGLGSLMQTAVLQRDLPLVQGAIVLTAVMFVLVNLLTDALYPLVDPRVKAVR